MKPSCTKVSRDEASEHLREYRLILGIVTVCSIMATLMFAPKFGAYFASLEKMLP